MPIVLGIIATIALIGGGVYFFAPGQTPVPAANQTEEVARTDSQASDETVTGVSTEAGVSMGPETAIAAGDAVVTPEAVTVVTPDAGAQTYTKSTTYLTPARTEHEITVNLTVSSAGIVTSADVTYDGGAGYSNGHQERFDNAFASEVTGKTLSEINLSRVGGASLTSAAFNEAVTEITTEQA